MNTNQSFKERNLNHTIREKKKKEVNSIFLKSPKPTAIKWIGE